jgi:hypothetical protein
MALPPVNHPSLVRLLKIRQPDLFRPKLFVITEVCQRAAVIARAKVIF